MAERHPASYPEAEEYHFPKTEVEVLEDELRHADCPEDFRLSILGLSRQYGNTKLLYGLKKYAVLSSISKIPTGEASSDVKKIDTDFYAGEVLAVHSVLKTQARSTRLHAWNQDFLSAYSPESNVTDEGDEALEYALGGMIQHRTDIYDALQDLPEDTQEALINVVGKMYHPHEQIRQDDFVAGYLYAREMFYFAMAEGVI